MKKSWEIKAFDDCIDKVKVTTKLPSSSYKEEGVYPIVSQEKELISGFWDNANDVILCETPMTIFGDHTMVVKYIDFDFVVGADGVKILKPKSFLNPKYFYYWVRSADISSRGYARHYRYLREKIVSIPSLAEQRRIVEILDMEFERIDALKANAEQRLQHAKDLFQSALKQELQPKEGWHKYQLADVCDYRKEQGQYTNLPYVGMENIESGSGMLLGVQRGEDMLSTTFRFRKDYVMYGRLRPYLKKVFVADFEGCCSTEIFPIVVDGVLPHLLKYWFLSDFITDKINATCGGCRMPRANMNDVKKFDIWLPSIGEQEEIVSRLEELNERCKALEENYKKTIALCDDMKQALLRKAFNGEL